MQNFSLLVFKAIIVMYRLLHFKCANKYFLYNYFIIIYEGKNMKLFMHIINVSNAREKIKLSTFQNYN